MFRPKNSSKLIVGERLHKNLVLLPDWK